jgi:hypothetical protein
MHSSGSTKQYQCGQFLAIDRFSKRTEFLHSGPDKDFERSVVSKLVPSGLSSKSKPSFQHQGAGSLLSLAPLPESSMLRHANRRRDRNDVRAGAAEEVLPSESTS